MWYYDMKLESGKTKQYAGKYKYLTCFHNFVGMWKYVVGVYYSEYS